MGKNMNSFSYQGYTGQFSVCTTHFSFAGSLGKQNYYLILYKLFLFGFFFFFYFPKHESRFEMKN